MVDNYANSLQETIKKRELNNINLILKEFSDKQSPYAQRIEKLLVEKNNIFIYTKLDRQKIKIQEVNKICQAKLNNTQILMN